MKTSLRTNKQSLLHKLIFILSYSAVFQVPAAAQGTVQIYMPFEPSNTQSQASLEFDSYYFRAGHRFYATRFNFEYAPANHRHQLGISAPVIHAIFNGDYAGYENTTGLGDLKFTYKGVAFSSEKTVLALNKVTAFVEVTVPTGNQQLGRGVGAWVYQPGVTVTYQPDIFWYFFPEFRFQFSAQEVNTLPGSDTTPDLDDPADDGRLKNFTISLPTTYTIIQWDGWIGLRADYSYSYMEDTYFLFFRIDVGKMIGQKTAATIQLNRFTAGQPRLDTFFKVKLTFFVR